MAESEPTFFSRLVLAFACLFRVLFDPRFAARVHELKSGRERALPAPQPETLREPAVDPAELEAREKAAADAGAVLMLALLQREGRLVDFVQQDISQFEDSEIGAVARVIHDGCRRSLEAHVKLVPVRSEAENSQVRVEEGYDAASTKLTGNVQGAGPYAGTLRHRGWQARSVKLPRRVGDRDDRVIAPAEVEL